MLKLPPGGMEPEFQLAPVDVWSVVSPFVHVTLPPTATVMGFGANAVAVSVDAPLTIDTGVPFGFPDGVGDGDGAAGDEYDDPHPNEAAKSVAAKTIRNFIMRTSPIAMAFRKCPAIVLSVHIPRVSPQSVSVGPRCGLRESTPLSGLVIERNQTSHESRGRRPGSQLGRYFTALIASTFRILVLG
jgi:hypothetical protein